MARFEDIIPRVLIAVPFVVLFLWFSILHVWYPFFLLLCIIGILSFIELFRLFKLQGWDGSVSLCVIFVCSFFLLAFFKLERFFPHLLLVSLIVFLGETIVRQIVSLKRPLFSLFIVFYAGFLPMSMFLIKKMDPVYVFYLSLNVWISDSAAYIFGLWLGRKKIFPKISPKKSYVGCFASMLASLLIGVVFSLWTSNPLFWAISIPLNIVSQIGDFSESILKREAGVKDSSELIPGHGGILDAFDSLLLASGFFYGTLTLLKVLIK